MFNIPIELLKLILLQFLELSFGAKAFTNLWFHNQIQAQKGESDDTNQASSKRQEIPN